MTNTNKIAKRFYVLLRSIKKKYRLLRGQEFFVTNKNGLKLLLDSNNLVDRHVDVSGGYEKKQIQRLSELMAKYKIKKFVDIGAHWGLYSLTLSKEKSLEPLEVVAFEPDRINRYQFYANLFLNRMENVVVKGCGLSSENGSISFLRNKGYNRGANKINRDGEHEIKIVKGDDVLPFKNEKLALKIDVEGHEVEVVSGLKNILSNNQCVLQVECMGEAEARLGSLLGSDYQYLGAIDHDHYFSNFSN